MGPGVEDFLLPAPGTDQGRFGDVPGPTGSQVDLRGLAPDLEDRECLAGRKGSREGGNSQGSLGSSSRDHIDRLAHWVGVRSLEPWRRASQGIRPGPPLGTWIVASGAPQPTRWT